MIIQEETN